MSKVLVLSLSGLGVGSAGVGGLLVLRPWESKVVTFSDKYKHSLLDISKDDSSWSSKYTSLKTDKPKRHAILVKAAEEAGKGTSANEVEAKRLMRKGCKAIYESAFENSEYKDDFKNYCSKTNEESTNSSKNWNDGNVSDASSNKWDSPLNSLKSHNETTKGRLVRTLADLKATLVKEVPLSQSHRETLKSWCEGIRKEPFMGGDSIEFRNQELYCKVS